MTSISTPAPRIRYWRRTSLIALALTIAGSADIANAQIYETGSIVEGKEIGEGLGVLYETDFGNIDIAMEQVATLSQPGPGQSGGWREGDFDGNGDVDFPDFLILSESYGTSSAASFAVPKPNTANLFGLRLLGSMLADANTPNATS